MTTAAPYPRLVADIGGSGCRIGWVEREGSDVDDVAAFDATRSPEAAIAAYLAGRDGMPPRSAALGVAAPVLGDTVSLTNRAWTFSIRDLGQRLGLARLVVVNDFAALAYGLPLLGAADVRPVGGGRAAAGAPMAIVGPGTGLGVSALVPGPAEPVVVVGEGGHVSLAAATPREDAVVAILRRRFGHVSAERVLSGDGLINLHDAVRMLDGLPAESRTAAQIAAAESAADPGCREAMALFFAFLGSVAGDLALLFGARGGVIVAGGIVARLGGAIDRSAFRERFEAKGRYRDYLAAIPTTVVIDSRALALRGANAALDCCRP
ncbi:MAG TPA: glucokinase [Caldimonas sp.]